MLSRLSGFAGRHRRKLIALGSVCAVGAAGYYYAKRLIQDGMRQVEELGRSMQERMLESQNRESELNRLRSECASIVRDFVTPLQNNVKRGTEFRNVTDELRELRARTRSREPTESENQRLDELWEELKVMSLSRLIVGIYALAMLNALLRVQLHVLGRYAFEEGARRRRAAAAASAGTLAEEVVDGQESKELVTPRLREALLIAGSQHMLNSNESMQFLVQRCSDCIRSATAQWRMGTDMTVDRREIIDCVDRIRGKVEGTQSAEQQGLSLSQEVLHWIRMCLIPEEEEVLFSADRELDEDQNGLLREMLEETLDMLDSPNFAYSIERSFDELFSVLGNDIRQMSFETTTAGQESFYLTKVVVNLKSHASVVLGEDHAGSPDERNKYEEALDNVEAVDSLCTAIFNQGVEDMDDPLTELGLGADDFGQLAGLLGGLQGAGGDADEEEMMRLFANLAGEQAGQQAGQGQGNNANVPFNDPQFMQMMRAISAQELNPQQGA